MTPVEVLDGRLQLFAGDVGRFPLQSSKPKPTRLNGYEGKQDSRGASSERRKARRRRIGSRLDRGALWATPAFLFSKLPIRDTDLRIVLWIPRTSPGSQQYPHLYIPPLSHRESIIGHYQSEETEELTFFVSLFYPFQGLQSCLRLFFSLLDQIRQVVPHSVFTVHSRVVFVI